MAIHSKHLVLRAVGLRARVRARHGVLVVGEEILPGSARRLELGTVEPLSRAYGVANLRPLGETVGLLRARIGKAASSPLASGKTFLN
jgi:hypothetical protein